MDSALRALGGRLGDLRSRIELLAGPRLADQGLRRLVTLPERGEARGALDDRAGALGVAPAEDSAPEGGEPDPEDQAHVDVRGLADDLLFEDARGLEEHRQEE